jgi:hypothetical protein
MEGWRIAPTELVIGDHRGSNGASYDFTLEVQIKSDLKKIYTAFSLLICPSLAHAVGSLPDLFSFSHLLICI